MKRQIASVIGVFVLLMVAACANAQNLNVKASVPFDFVVNKAALPAGAYNIESMSSAGSSTLLIRGAQTQMVVLPNNARSLNPSPDTRLVFHRYGSQYFLSQIWTQGEAAGRQLRISRREAEMAKNIQRSEDVIVLAALR